MTFVILLLLTGRNNHWSAAYSGEMLDDALIYVVERCSIAVIVEVDFHECSGLRRQSLEYVHEHLFLKSGSRAFVKYSKIHFLKKDLELFLHSDPHMLER